MVICYPINLNRRANPVGLIYASWILFALCLVDQILAETNMGLAIVLDIAAIICAILLAINKNKTAKVNGIIILSIWAFAIIIGIALGAFG